MIVPERIFPAIFLLFLFCTAARAKDAGKYATIKTEKRYFQLLDAADDSTFRREFESEFVLLLSEDQRKEYAQRADLHAKKNYIKHYWEKQNPNPLLPQNDRLLDHLQRRAYARKNFPIDTPPYFDDRGKFFIKYGKPKFRYRDLGGQRSMEGLVRVPFKYYAVIPNESWSYVNVTSDFVVHFMEKNGAYVQIESLRKVIQDTRRQGRVVWYWFDLLKRRFWMSGLVTDTVNEIEAIETDLMIANGGSGATVDRVGSPLTRVSEEMFRNLTQAQHELNLVHLHVPPVTYNPIYAKNKLRFTPVVAQFKGRDGNTRVEVALFTPLKQYTKRARESSVQIDFRCMVSNSDLDSLTTRRKRKSIPLQLASESSLRTTGELLVVQVPPQEVELAFQIQNLDDDQIGFRQEDVELRDFSGDSLMMSDIQYLTEIGNPETKALLPILERQELSLAPYPYKKIRKSTPLFCYFEIYNLAKNISGKEFELSYKLVRDPSRKGVLKKLLTSDTKASIEITERRALTENTAREVIQLDLNKLENGPYILEIAVRDPDDPAQSVHAVNRLDIEN